MKKLFLLLTLSSFLFAEVEPYKAKNFYHLVGMPGFSESALSMHFKLYEGYVKNTNAILARLQELQSGNQQNTLEYSGLKKNLGFEFDGMKLHEAYFENLGGKVPLSNKAKLYQKIVNDFGSFDTWQKDFINTGMLRGIGWVALYYDIEDNRLVNVWIQEHQTNPFVNCHLLLVMDVWEHAYLTEYGLDRRQYIDAFMKNIQWGVVNSRYNNAK